jgi:hypothetical protein
MDVALVISRGHTGCGGVVTLLVEACQVEAEEDDYKQQEHVAAHVGGKSSKVARGVLVSEDLGACADGMLEDEVWRVMMGDFEVMLTDCVTDRPCDEVHGDGDGLFRLTGDVSEKFVNYGTAVAMRMKRLTSTTDSYRDPERPRTRARCNS